MVFAVADEEKSIKTFHNFTGEVKDYEINLEQNSAYKTFQNEMRPTDIEMEGVLNQQVIRQLQSAGCNLQAVHEIEFIFLGTNENLEQVKSDLLQKDYGLLDDSEEGILIMTKDLELTGQLNEITYEFKNILSNKYNVEYDGWRTAIVE
jgi:regulator of RNase E activity RraB